MRRWLYLDFDGCLHPSEVYIDPRRDAPYLVGPGSLFMWAPLLVTALDPFPQVEIVSSTSWAAHCGLERAKRYLPQTLQRRVISQSAPARDRHRRARGIEVEDHVARNCPQYWIALDDDEDGWTEAGLAHLVLCDSAQGLGERRVYDVLCAKLREMHR
jgi:hypothetical protein